MTHDTLDFFFGFVWFRWFNTLTAFQDSINRFKILIHQKMLSYNVFSMNMKIIIIDGKKESDILQPQIGKEYWWWEREIWVTHKSFFRTWKKKLKNFNHVFGDLKVNFKWTCFRASSGKRMEQNFLLTHARVKKLSHNHVKLLMICRIK